MNTGSISDSCWSDASELCSEARDLILEVRHRCHVVVCI